MAKVLEVKKSKEKEYVDSLIVHWFDNSTDVEKGTDPVLSKFFPYYTQKKATKRRKLTNSSVPPRKELQIPSSQEIHTDTVLTSFPSLTKKNKLPVQVQNHLQ